MKFSILIEKIFKTRSVLGIGSEIPLEYPTLRLTETSEEPSQEKVDQIDHYLNETPDIKTVEIPEYLTVQYEKGELLCLK